MTFYQELQLNSAGSKALIRITRDKKERMRHILIYNFKVYLVVAFCFAAVTLFSMIFGNENSIAGVVVLLALLVLRQADFGIHTSHGLLCIAGIFGILMTGPRLSNMVSPFAAFFINLICILLLMLLGCHNVIMSNHSTFVLSYLILQGYDVSGYSWMMRTAGLFVGMLLCMAVFYKNQKHRLHKREFKDLFHEFDPRSLRNRWYIKLTLCVSTVLFQRYADHVSFGTSKSNVGRNCLYVRVPSLPEGSCKTGSHTLDLQHPGMHDLSCNLCRSA